jgi:hypothetical protein
MPLKSRLVEPPVLKSDAKLTAKERGTDTPRPTVHDSFHTYITSSDANGIQDVTSVCAGESCVIRASLRAGSVLRKGSNVPE